MKRQLWQKPELIILGRSRAEEVVLGDGCKKPKSGSGPGNNSNGCGVSGVNNCSQCGSRVGNIS